jgi:AraC-like DNA-binding protein
LLLFWVFYIVRNNPRIPAMSYIPQIIENAPKLSFDDQAIVWGLIQRLLPEKPKEVDVLDLFPKPPTDSRVVAAVQFIWKNPSKSTKDLDEYFCTEFKLGWDTVARRFPHETGVTAKKALDFARLELARRVIIKDRRSIPVALIGAGINISHFESKFKARYGMTPLKYRRLYAEF